jgi:hypothetical protein
MITLDSIFEVAPLVNKKKWAVFGVKCLWWSCDPEDCGFFDGGPLPRCYYCGGLLDQRPLDEFIEQAKADPDLYGPGGLKTLLSAHHPSRGECHQLWEEYI